MKGHIQDKKVAQPMKSIEEMERKRQDRRLKMEEYKREKKEKQAYNLACGKNVDVDYQIMIEKNMFTEKMLIPHTSSADVKIAICVRKRPIFQKEEKKGQIDAISCANPQIMIHQPKVRVDLSKYVENHKFTYDNTFNEEQNTSDIYDCSLKPLLPLLISEGIVTCFAYGQTGSGKTYTMNGLQKLIVTELFQLLSKGNYQVCVSFFEIYGGRCLDLLNNKQALNILEDEFNHIQIPGLVQKNANNAQQLLKIMDAANIARTTHCTVANDTSSRSHSICQVIVRSSKRQIGKLVLVDLAGSQRAADTQSNNRQRRMEGAEINKSLLALKQCIRAMDSKADHIPFRSSKLTLILRNSFLSKKAKSKIVMIACVSPGTSSSDHSLNTLRYAARLKDNTKASKKCDQIVLQRKNSSRCQDIQDDIRKRIQSNQNESFKTPKVSQKTPSKQNKENEQKNSNVPNSLKKLPQLPKIIKNVSKQQDNKPQVFPPINNKVKKPMSAYDKIQRPPKLLPSEQIQEQIVGEQVEMPKKNFFHECPNELMETFKGLNDQSDFLKFTQKVSNLYEEQQQLFAVHMAAMKQDAKMLSKQSDLIGSIKGVGYIDYDIDEYVQKLDNIVQKKLKVYQILSRELKKFKNSLDEEDQMRKKINNAIYY